MKNFFKYLKIFNEFLSNNFPFWFYFNIYFIIFLGLFFVYYFIGNVAFTIGFGTGMSFNSGIWR